MRAMPPTAAPRLPEKYKTCVYLHYYEGYKTDEIAAMTGTPASTVRSRSKRGPGAAETGAGRGDAMSGFDESEREEGLGRSIREAFEAMGPSPEAEERMLAALKRAEADAEAKKDAESGAKGAVPMGGNEGASGVRGDGASRAQGSSAGAPSRTGEEGSVRPVTGSIRRSRRAGWWAGGIRGCGGVPGAGGGRRPVRPSEGDGKRTRIPGGGRPWGFNLGMRPPVPLRPPTGRAASSAASP